MPNEVILLVGGNPLPNYVAAHALRCTHEINQVHLLYTDEVEDVKNNLFQCLTTSSFSCRESYIRDAGNAEAIRYACGDICNDSHLHYTGGTNTMAVHVHAEWEDVCSDPNQASYLFARDDLLIFDDGTKESISSHIQLDLPTLATLHGLTDADLRSSSAFPTDPQLGDADVIAQHVFCKPKLAQQMYDEVADKESVFKKNPFDPSAKGLTLSIGGPIPDNSWSNRQIKPWLKFLRGVWLEEWIYQQIKNTGEINCKYLYVGIEPKIKGRPFELDVVAIRGHHLYVMSCTISANTGLCKSKLFEVAMRARQLGGDMARSALVCLAEQRVVDNLQKDVESLSESSRVPQVFGLNDVRGWMGYGGSAPNLTSLSDWLKD